MGVSKVTLNGVTLMDVTDKTVDTDNLLNGETALRNDGESISGAVVTAAASDTAPAMDGTASAGSATTYSRGDHVHPSDTSKQAVITATGILKGNGAGSVTAATIDDTPTNNSTNLVTSGGVFSAIPTKTSDLTNDSSFITASGAPVQSVNSKTGAVVLTASDVGALPDDTPIPQGTVTSVRVQATSPVQSSTNTAQSTTLNTTISLADSYGDTKNPYAAKAKNTVLAGPSTGTATAPSFRTLEADDIPSLTVSKISDFPSTMTPSSHSHGYVSNDGKVLSQSAIGNGDRLVITDSSDSDKIATSSITFGTSTTTFLTNKGTWKTPNYPVTSVNTKTGAVSLTASDVGALPDTTEVPTATSDLTNDSGFITSSDIPVTSVNTKTGAVSLSASDVGALPDSTDVTKWNGVELSKTVSDLSNQEAIVPFLWSSSETTARYAKVSKVPSYNCIAQYSNGYLNSTTPSASDNSTKVATTAYVDSAINELGSLLTFKGVVATTGDLPGSGNDVGDVWVVSEDNSEHVWTGEAWERLGTTVDLSGYVPTSRTVNGKALSANISLSASDVSALPDSTDVTKWNDVALNKSEIVNTGDKSYVAGFSGSNTSTKAAGFYPITRIPAAHNIPKYDANAYLISTTPAANDNSTKVATTAYVDSAVGGITVPVTSVNSKTGAVVLTAADVGALPTTTSIPSATSDLTNDSGFITISDVPEAPVLSVNGSTGTVELTATDVGAQEEITATGILMGDGSGGITAAVSGTDYIASLTSGTGISVSGTTINHSNSVTAATAGTSSATSGSSLAVPYITYDAQGHITGSGTHTHTVSGFAASTHAHGNITSAGDITTTATIASGDRIVINDESASKVTNSSITFGTATTTFLANNGTWQTPAKGSTATTRTASLAVASWNTSSKQITVTVSGVTASNLVEVSPAPASWSVASAAGVYCSAQAANSLTFKCSSIPTAAITVNVVIWG